MPADKTRVAIAADIQQIQQDIREFQQRERHISTQLELAVRQLQTFTRVGQMPDPAVQAQVNNHSVALNRVRGTLAALWQKKGEAEQALKDLTPAGGH